MSATAYDGAMEFDECLRPTVLAVDTRTLASAALTSQPPKPNSTIESDRTFLIEHDAVGIAGWAHLPFVRNDQIKGIFHRQKFEAASSMVSLLLGWLRPPIRNDDDGFVCANGISECKD